MFINFKRDNVLIKANAIRGVYVEFKKMPCVCIDVGSEEDYEVPSYRYNEVIAIIATFYESPVTSVLEV